MRFGPSMFILMAAVVTAWGFADTANKFFDQYGFAQYRLRVKWDLEAPAGGQDLSTWNYYNQIGYYYGVKVTPVRQVLLQFQVGNNWYSTETVSWKTPPAAPRFNLAFARWDAGWVNLWGGIVPIQNNGALDLLSRSSVCEDNAYHTYAKAAFLGWGDATNNGLAGLRLGVPIVKKDFSLSASLFTSIIETRQQIFSAAPKPDPNSVLTVLEVPFAWQSLTVTGQFAGLFYRNFNASTGKADHEMSGGFAATYQVNPAVALTADAGVATVANTESGPGTVTVTMQSYADSTTGIVKTRSIADTADAAAYRQLGILAGIGASVKAGPGKIIGAFRYSRDENHDVTGSGVSYYFVDLKYSWDISGNFSIMPRLRIYDSFYDVNHNAEWELRPEMIFSGKF